METDYTLKAMESCDFSTPLSVTIIDDDSDEDTKDILDLNERNSYHDCPTPKLYMETEHDNLSKSLEERKTSKKRGTVTQKLDTCEKLIVKLRKGDDSCVNENYIKKKKNKTKCKKVKKSKSTKNLVSTTQKNCRDLEPIESYAKFSPAKEKMKANNNKSLEEQINSNDNSVLETKRTDENNEATNRYVNDLLTKVSESLLYVLDAYHNHLDNVINKSNDSWYVNESKRRYTRIKHHFYQLSFCTTNIIILSQENNPKFTEEFLKNTVKLAEVRHNKKITVQQIQPYYYEMLSWAKQKKELHCIPVSPVNNEKSLPLLRKQLREPPKLPNVEYSPNENNFSIPKVSIHNDAHNREIRISLEPHLPPVNNKTQPNVCNVAPQPVEKLIQKEYYESEKRYQIMDPLKSYDLLQMHKMTSRYDATYDTRKLYRSSISEVTSPTANVYKQSFVNESRCDVVNCRYLEQHQQHNKDVTNPMNMRFPHSQPPTLPSYEQSFYWNNFRKANENQPVNNVEYHNIIMNAQGNNNFRKANENQPVNNVEYHNIIMNAQSNIDTSRSSVSTDSGFISPQHLISPMDNTSKMRSFTPEQMDTLLNFLDEHKDLAHGKLRSLERQVATERLWVELCNTLNSMDGCTKTIKQWQKVWFNRKYMAKKAAADARRSALATGGGRSTESYLTQRELKVLSIMGDGFGGRPTGARVPAFDELSPEEAIMPSPMPQNNEIERSPPRLRTESASQQLEFEESSTSRHSSKNARARRRKIAASVTDVRGRLFLLEEGRMVRENIRNSELAGIRAALLQLNETLLREYLDIY